jgi:hypothetical protein
MPPLTYLLRVVLLASITHALRRSDTQARNHTSSTSLGRLAKFMPASSLAAPIGELKYVVLGLGTQNYTCASTNQEDAPGTTGAIGL